MGAGAGDWQVWRCQDAAAVCPSSVLAAAQTVLSEAEISTEEEEEKEEDDTL